MFTQNINSLNSQNLVDGGRVSVDSLHHVVNVVVVVGGLTIKSSVEFVVAASEHALLPIWVQSLSIEAHVVAYFLSVEAHLVSYMSVEAHWVSHFVFNFLLNFVLDLVLDLVSHLVDNLVHTVVTMMVVVESAPIRLLVHDLAPDSALGVDGA